MPLEYEKQVDIVLPVHNSLSCIKDCITSIAHNTPSDLYRLYVIDDFSAKIIC
jgi:glycosyltransferase involved in cell wall biosynthesis